MDNAILLIRKIKKFQHKKLVSAAWANLIHLIICILCIWSASVVADQIFYFSTTTRWFILIGTWFSILGCSILLYLPPFLSMWHIYRSADLSPLTREIGRMYPEIGDRLTNIYQLISRDIEGTSVQLKEFAIKSFYEQIKDFDLQRRLKFINRLVPLPALILFVAGNLYLVSTFDLSPAIGRIWNPAGDYGDIPAFTFEIHPGNTQVILGQPVEIKARYTGPVNSGCILLYRSGDETTFQQLPLRLNNGVYEGMLSNIRHSLDYRVKSAFIRPAEWSDKIISDLYRIQVLIPPLITELSVTVSPPAYTGLPRQYPEKNTGDFLAYPGSMVSLSARTNKRINEAKIIFADSSVINPRIQEETFQAQFAVKENTIYHIDLLDQQGVNSINPIQYTITVLQDLYPTVELIEPGKDVEIPSADGALNLLLEGKDDFGFSNLKLFYRISGNSEFAQDTLWHEQPLSLPQAGKVYFQQNYLWNFALLDIGFEDAVTYFLEIRDNDPVRGPKTSRSAEYQIRFPSVETLLNSFSQQQVENVQELERITTASDDLKNKLEEINRELKRDQSIDWQKKKEIETSLKKQNELQAHLDQIQQNLEEAIQKLESAQLLSPEVLESYRQLQQLFQEIATPEFLQAMEELQKAMEKWNDGQVKNSLQKFQFNQQQFKERLERTLELFRKVQLEQELDRLVQMTRTMLEEQQKISEQLTTSSPLAKEQQSELLQELQAQHNLFRQTEEQLETLIQNDLLLNHDELKENLVAVQEQMQQKDLAAQFENMQGRVRENNPVPAGQQSRQVQQNLQQQYTALQQIRQDMLAADQSRLQAKMQKTAQDLLYLSADQEELMNETARFSDYSSGYREMILREQNMMEKMNGTMKAIIDLSHETFFISPEISRALGKAGSGMRKTMEELQNRNQETAAKAQQQAMSGLNEAVMEIQKSMQQMSQSSSALGFEQFMQSLQQMSRQQGLLNEQSLNFMNGAGNQGALSYQQQQELRRLAAEQSAVQQALQQLLEQAGERSDMLGRLDQAAEEMGKVVQDMERARVDRRTIERQQQIFNRMLDAQKSVREREYSRNRQAETGKNYVRKSPPNTNEQGNARLQKLQRDLQRALQEGYYPDYEKIIEDYFKALSQSPAADEN
jgi:hypothetical protein